LTQVSSPSCQQDVSAVQRQVVVHACVSPSDMFVWVSVHTRKVVLLALIRHAQALIRHAIQHKAALRCLQDLVQSEVSQD